MLCGQRKAPSVRPPSCSPPAHHLLLDGQPPILPGQYTSWGAVLAELVSMVQTRRSPCGHHSSLAQWLPQTHFTPVLLFLLLQPIPSSLFPLPPLDDWLMSLSGSSSKVKAISGTCRVSRMVTWPRKVCRHDCPHGATFMHSCYCRSGRTTIQWSVSSRLVAMRTSVL